MSLTVSEISSPEDYAAWDRFVIQHPEGSFAQLSGWANLKQQFEWQSHILVIRDEEEIVAGALMMDRVGLLGKKVSYVPFGPLVGEKHDQTLPMLTEGLIRESESSVVLRLEPHTIRGKGEAVRGKGLTEYLVKVGFEASHRYLQPEATLMLDLGQPEAEILAGMRQTTRRYIRQAERAGLKVVEDPTGNRLKEFYTILQQVNQRRQFGVHTLEYYTKAWEAFKRTGYRVQGAENQEDNASLKASDLTLNPALIQPYLFFVQKDDQVLGAYFVVRAGHKSWELYGGVNEAGMGCKANYWLKWQSILAMKHDGVVLYDQWGVAPLRKVEGEQSGVEKYDQGHHLAGVTYFKEGFGGKRIAYAGSYDKVNQPLFYGLAQLLGKL